MRTGRGQYAIIRHMKHMLKWCATNTEFAPGTGVVAWEIKK